LLELGTAGIHVAEYRTVLPPPEILREKLHQSIETARRRLELRAGEQSEGRVNEVQHHAMDGVWQRFATKWAICFCAFRMQKLTASGRLISIPCVTARESGCAFRGEWLIRR
jgi:hypothetical protein